MVERRYACWGSQAGDGRETQRERETEREREREIEGCRR